MLIIHLHTQSLEVCAQAQMVLIAPLIIVFTMFQRVGHSNSQSILKKFTGSKVLAI